MKKILVAILLAFSVICNAQSTPIRDYLNVMKRSDLRGWIFQHGQLIASMGHTVMNDSAVETWYFDENSMAVDDGTDNATALRPNDIAIGDPGRYLKTMVQADWNNTLNKPLLFSGNYNDLTNKPPTISQINLTGGNRISITGTYPNMTISYIEPSVNIVSRSINTNYTISATKQATVFYSVTCNVTNPLLAGSSTAMAYLEYSTNGGANWVLLSQNGNGSAVGVAVAIQLTNSQTGVLAGIIPANALSRIRTTTTGTGIVVTVTGQETY